MRHFWHHKETTWVETKPAETEEEATEKAGEPEGPKEAKYEFEPTIITNTATILVRLIGDFTGSEAGISIMEGSGEEARPILDIAVKKAERFEVDFAKLLAVHGITITLSGTGLSHSPTTLDEIKDLGGNVLLIYED